MKNQKITKIVTIALILTATAQTCWGLTETEKAAAYDQLDPKVTRLEQQYGPLEQRVNSEIPGMQAQLRNLSTSIDGVNQKADKTIREKSIANVQALLKSQIYFATVGALKANPNLSLKHSLDLATAAVEATPDRLLKLLPAMALLDKKITKVNLASLNNFEDIEKALR